MRWSTFLFCQFVGSCLSLSPPVSVSTNCNNLHPALLRQAYGANLVDYSKDLPNTKPNQRSLYPLFQFTCNQRKNFTLPFQDNVKIQVPDQLILMTLPTGSYLSTSKCYTNFELLKTAVFSNIHDWEKSPLGSFSSTDGTTEFTIPPHKKCLIRISNRRYEFEARPSSVYDLSETSSPLLDSDFERAFNALPESLGLNQAVFDQFFEKYGTGYYAKGFYGNAIDVWVITERYVDGGVSTVKSALASYNPNSAYTNVGGWIKLKIDASNPGSAVDSTVIVRSSSSGRWSETGKDMFSGDLVNFDRRSILPQGQRLDTLEEAKAVYLTNKRFEKDWRGDWNFKRE